VQKEGGLGEVFYPTLGSPSVRALEFVVADGRGHAEKARAAGTTGTDDRSLRFRQAFKGEGWRLDADYTTDPARSTVLVSLRFDAPGGYRLYAVYDPALGNSRGGDAGATRGDALVATDGDVSSALVASPGFSATSSGFAGVSDGLTDLLKDGRMDWRYPEASAGSLVQTAELGGTDNGEKAGEAQQRADHGPSSPQDTSAATAPRRQDTAEAGDAGLGRHGGGARRYTVALAFGGDAAAALGTARASLRHGFGDVARAYAEGWHRYLGGLKAVPPVSSRGLYLTSAMVLAASEDKTHPGAYVAAPAAPWAFGSDDPSGPYHLVWSRDLYQIATALIADGDRGGAGRALDFLFETQQKPDGSFPQNSTVDGTPVWGGLQLDEVALPIVLAYQLGRRDAGTWRHVKAAADFLLGFPGAPATPQERWENQSGYSPGTIAAEIAGLVCAADLARANGDEASAQRYLTSADEWRANVKAWTLTTNGPYSDKPYFLRLTKDGQPNSPTKYDIGDSGPTGVDQRTVVDPSFLDLVRLGVLPANDPDIVNTLSVIDKQLGVPTARGFFWHRASFDGYGEKLDGSQWAYDMPPGSLLTRGRAWPLLNGERGEYQLAAGAPAGARTQLTTMTRAAGPGGMLPEQVWDLNPPAPAVTPGTPTTSATPLAWTHAQYLRLAQNLKAGRITEQPRAVAERYRN
jgi:glucoamylase